MSTPKSDKSGSVHVSFLSFFPASYPGNGIYLADVLLALESQPLARLLSKTIGIRPRVGVSKAMTFGWEADGAVINGTYAAVLTFLALFSIMSDAEIPKPLADALGGVRALFHKLPQAPQ